MVRIGITRCHRVADYIEAVAASGAEPVVLDVDHGPQGLLKDLDGLVLSGGGDVDPALFGEAPHPAYSPAEEGRDAAEIALVHAALESKTPVLAICRGIQVLNVAAGGTLVQDIPTAGAALSRAPHRQAQGLPRAPGRRQPGLDARCPARNGCVPAHRRRQQPPPSVGEGGGARLPRDGESDRRRDRGARSRTIGARSASACSGTRRTSAPTAGSASCSGA